MTRIREASIKPWELGWLETVGQDACHGPRGLARNPLLMPVAVLSLSLGIGANLALYSLLESVFPNRVTAREP